jgi:hypothetical protein
MDIMVRTESSDWNGLIILTPKLMLQLNSGQLKLDGLQQIATIGIIQSVILAVGIFADCNNFKLITDTSNFLLGQLTDIWNVRNRSKITICMFRTVSGRKLKINYRIKHQFLP